MSKSRFYGERPPWTWEKLERIRVEIELDVRRGVYSFAAEKRLRQLRVLLALDEAVARIPQSLPQ
jgi:hypothetical protein